MRLALALALLLVATPVLAAPQTLILDPSPGATAYEVEVSTDIGVTWKTMTPQLLPSACSATQCTYVVTPGPGWTLYRWAVITGTTRTLRTDAAAALCVGLPACPFPASGVGVK